MDEILVREGFYPKRQQSRVWRSQWPDTSYHDELYEVSCKEQPSPVARAFSFVFLMPEKIEEKDVGHSRRRVHRAIMTPLMRPLYVYKLACAMRRLRNPHLSVASTDLSSPPTTQQEHKSYPNRPLPLLRTADRSQTNPVAFAGLGEVVQSAASRPKELVENTKKICLAAFVIELAAVAVAASLPSEAP